MQFHAGGPKGLITQYLTSALALGRDMLRSLHSVLLLISFSVPNSFFLGHTCTLSSLVDIIAGYKLSDHMAF